MEQVLTSGQDRVEQPSVTLPWVGAPLSRQTGPQECRPGLTGRRRMIWVLQP